jgi:hypothetical protein
MKNSIALLTCLMAGCASAAPVERPMAPERPILDPVGDDLALGRDHAARGNHELADLYFRRALEADAPRAMGPHVEHLRAWAGAVERVDTDRALEILERGVRDADSRRAKLSRESFPMDEELVALDRHSRALAASHAAIASRVIDDAEAMAQRASWGVLKDFADEWWNPGLLARTVWEGVDDEDAFIEAWVRLMAVAGDHLEYLEPAARTRFRNLHARIMGELDEAQRLEAETKAALEYGRKAGVNR